MLNSYGREYCPFADNQNRNSLKYKVSTAQKLEIESVAGRSFGLFCSCCRRMSWTLSPFPAEVASKAVGPDALVLLR
jgi:hypothetical protein